MRLKNFFTTNLVFASGLILSACGGSSSSDGDANFGGASGSPAARSNSYEAATRAPQSGSVVQTSVAGIGSAIGASATYNGGSPHISVTLNSRTFDTADSDTALGRRFETVEGAAGVYASRDLPDGTLVTRLYTDIASADDTDYLVGGIWFYVPDDTDNLADAEVGAFVDGTDPFDDTNILALTGTATYNGGASALFLNASTDEVIEVASENAVLTADFGSASALGTIEGTITEFAQYEDDVLVTIMPTVEVTLEQANIGGSDSGFFTGETTLTYQGETYDQGHWGGQFYGNGADTEAPTTVVGTFGVAGDNADEGYILGTFTADR